MPALNFKNRFVPLIASGDKRQTIRKKRADGRDPKAGQVLLLFNGLRTKECKRIASAVCMEVRDIAIYDEGVTYSNGEHVKDEFARADGFRDWEEMRLWFKDLYGLPFYGLLIRWGNLQK